MSLRNNCSSGILQILFGLFFCLSFLAFSSHSFDLKLDKERDRILWKFSGHYLYTQSGNDLQDLLDDSIGKNSEALLLPQTEQFANSTIIRDGIWFTKYIPNRQNRFILTYTLKHQLFKQGWISFFATPNVQVKVSTNSGQVIGNFWSNGASWCDAVISEGLKTTITIEITTSNAGDYFLLDKVVMGIFTNVTQLNGKTLNPCLETPLNSSSILHKIPELSKVNIMDLDSKTISTTIVPTTTTMTPKLSRQSRDFSSNQQNVELDLNKKADSENIPLINGQSLDSRNLSKSNSVDLTMEIPIDSKIVQMIKHTTINASELENNNLKCSCTCNTNSKMKMD